MPQQFQMFTNHFPLSIKRQKILVAQFIVRVFMFENTQQFTRQHLRAAGRDAWGAVKRSPSTNTKIEYEKTLCREFFINLNNLSFPFIQNSMSVMSCSIKVRDGPTSILNLRERSNFGMSPKFNTWHVYFIFRTHGWYSGWAIGCHSVWRNFYSRTEQYDLQVISDCLSLSVCKRTFDTKEIARVWRHIFSENKEG